MASWYYKIVIEIIGDLALLADFGQHLTPLSCVLFIGNHHLFNQQRFIKYQCYVSMTLDTLVGKTGTAVLADCVFQQCHTYTYFSS